MNKENEELKKRFVSDFKLPIAITREPYYSYFIDLYEEEYQSRTKWDNLLDFIEKNYDGNSMFFLEDYYSVRNNIITTVEKSEAYQRFNNCDMSKYNIGKINVSSNNIYQNLNIGQRFLSIDLKKANFQALKLVDPEIVLNADTYEDFIGKFTELDYIKQSKYTRQVVFGKLNPKRHITVEKYIVKQILDYINENKLLDNGFTLVSFANDELVYRIEGSETKAPDTEQLEKSIKEHVGFDVSVEEFVLYGLKFTSLQTHEELQTIFFKIGNGGKTKIKSCPITYHSMAYKALHKLQECYFDHCIKYENVVCLITETFEHKIMFEPEKNQFGTKFEVK